MDNNDRQNFVHTCEKFGIKARKATPEELKRGIIIVDNNGRYVVVDKEGNMRRLTDKDIRGRGIQKVDAVSKRKKTLRVKGVKKVSKPLKMFY